MDNKDSPDSHNRESSPSLLSAEAAFASATSSTLRHHTSFDEDWRRSFDGPKSSQRIFKRPSMRHPAPSLSIRIPSAAEESKTSTVIQAVSFVASMETASAPFSDGALVDSPTEETAPSQPVASLTGDNPNNETPKIALTGGVGFLSPELPSMSSRKSIEYTSQRRVSIGSVYAGMDVHEVDLGISKNSRLSVSSVASLDVPSMSHSRRTSIGSIVSIGVPLTKVASYIERQKEILKPHVGKLKVKVKKAIGMHGYCMFVILYAYNVAHKAFPN